MTGLTRRSRGRACAERRPRPHAAADRPLSARPAARPRRHRQSPAASAHRPELCRRPRQRAGERHHRRPHHGPGGAARLRPREAARAGARRGRPVEPCRHRRAGARHCRLSAWCRASSTSSRRATRSSSTARPARCMCARSPTSQSAYAEKAPLRARRQEQYAQAARRAGGHQGRRRDRAAYECGARHRRAACAETGAQSIGLFRTELQFMLAPRFPRMDEQLRFYKARSRRGARPARHLPHARHRLGQDPALYGEDRRGKSRRSAGGRSASASTGRDCCACSCAPC